MGNIQKGRKTLLLPKHFSAVLAIHLLYYAPTFVACTPTTEIERKFEEEHKTIQIRLKSSPMALSCLDIFVFNDNPDRRLDAYTRIEDCRYQFGVAASRTGKKLMVILANSKSDRYSWSSINSWKSLEKTYFSLAEEEIEKMTMLASYSLENHSIELYELEIQPLLARINLKSLSFDFKEGKFAGQSLSKVRCYLTNVCNRYPAVHTGWYKCSSYFNSTRLSETDLKKMKDPSLLYVEWDETISEHSFYCYPNVIEKKGIGQPSTRLVIEGELGGTTYYYPINLDMATFLDINGSILQGWGIEGGYEYNLDIRITRPGVLDPDLPISSKEAKVKIQIKEWTEKKKEIIEY